MGKSNDRIYCTDGTVCKNTEFTSRNAGANEKNWVCPKCEDVQYTVDLFKILGGKMLHVGAHPGDINRFAVRELVQNADDAHSNILVLRVDDDALYVSNDGLSFRNQDRAAGKSGDFQRLCEVMSHSKKNEAQTVGQFGTGFQTVYCFTNHPEIHSSGKSLRLDPTSLANRVTHLPSADDPKSRTPFFDKKEESMRGVLFRLPWRTDEEAAREYDGVSRFEDEIWPRWGPDQIRDFVEDLQKYLHDLVLCCQHLKCIRLIWNKGKKAYQVARSGFELDRHKYRPYGAYIEEGFVDVSDDWESSFGFAQEEWSWKDMISPEGGWKYLISSSKVKDSDNNDLFFGLDENNKKEITPNIELLKACEGGHEGRTVLFKNDVHVILPFFDPAKRPFGKPTYFRYSVLPIPVLGENGFACTAHINVVEDRSNILLSGKSESWYEYVTVALKHAYQNGYLELLSELGKLDLPISEKQSIALRCLPGGKLCGWLNCKNTSTDILDEEEERLKERLFQIPLLFFEQKMITPEHSHYTEDEDLLTIGPRMDLQIIPKEVWGHPLFGRLIDSPDEYALCSDTFIEAWRTFHADNEGTTHDLKKGQALSDGSSLDNDLIKCLISYCLNHESTRELPVVPDRNGTLRSESSFPWVSSKFKSLLSLLDDRCLVHSDFHSVIHENLQEEKSPTSVLTYLSQAVTHQHNRFDGVSEEDLDSIISVVKATVMDDGFALRAVKDLSFIPYRQKDKVRMGKPNRDDAGKEIPYDTHTGENYKRWHIFAPHKGEVPGLSAELKKGIKFIELAGVPVKMITPMCKKLGLVSLMPKTNKPTNFVRVYISDKADRSLFNDDVLTSFLETQGGIKKEKITPALINKQKVVMLDAVKAYFEPNAEGEEGLKKKNMKTVPCLFGPDKVWRAAGDFFFSKNDTLELLGKKPLHPMFLSDEWKGILVNRLGVSESADMTSVIATIKTLSKEKKSRPRLQSILEWLLTSEINLEHDGKALGEIEDLDINWIPSVGGSLARPRDALLPVTDNTIIVGDSYQNLADLGKKALDDVSKSVLNTRAKKIGLKITPETKDLLRIIEECYKADKAPPAQLFSVLSNKAEERLSQEEHKERIRWQAPETTTGHEIPVYQGKVPANVYFHDGKWWGCDDIRIMDNRDIPDTVQGLYLIIPSDSPHRPALQFYMGVKKGLHDYEVLDQMVRMTSDDEPDIYMSLWEFLADMPCSKSDVKATYGHLELFPAPGLDGKLIAPNRLLLTDNQTFKESGKWGDWYAVEQSDTRIPDNVLNKLKELGMKEAYELDAHEIVSMLESFYHGNQESQDINYHRMMRLIHRLATIEEDMSADTFSELQVPIRMSGRIQCKRISECFLNDSFRAALFKDSIPLLDTLPGQKGSEILKKFYQRHKALSLDASLRPKAVRIPEDKPIPEPEQLIRFKEMKKALTILFEGLPLSEEDKRTLCGSINWLDSCKIMRYDDIRVVCELDNTLRSTSGYDIEIKNECVVINLARIVAERIYDELAADIFRTCVQMMEPPRSLVTHENSVKSAISRLLATEPWEWDYILTEYKPDNRTSPPPLFTEILESTTDGYYNTRYELKEWYNACQICMARTPADCEGNDSCETVTSIISMKGGLYKGAVDEYSPKNCLFLCPNHQALFKRRLIKVPFLDEAQGADKAKRKELIKIISGKRANVKKLDKGNIINVIWEVYETPMVDGSDFNPQSEQWEWGEKGVKFRVKHYIEHLNGLINYLEELKDE